MKFGGGTFGGGFGVSCGVFGGLERPNKNHGITIGNLPTTCVSDINSPSGIGTPFFLTSIVPGTIKGFVQLVLRYKS